MEKGGNRCSEKESGFSYEVGCRDVHPSPQSTGSNRWQLMNYRVVVKGARPPALARKIAEAHAKALTSKHFSDPLYGKDITKSNPAAKKKEKETTGA